MITKLDKPIQPVSKDITDSCVTRIMIDFLRGKNPVHRVTEVFGTVESGEFITDSRLPTNDITVQADLSGAVDLQAYVTAVKAAKVSEEKLIADKLEARNKAEKALKDAQEGLTGF